MFSTLDPTTRRIELNSGREVLLTELGVRFMPESAAREFFTSRAARILGHTSSDIRE